MIYWNRETITAANVVRGKWGLDRSSQTNSTRNGHYGILRFYHRPEDKGKPRLASLTVESLKVLRQLRALVGKRPKWSREGQMIYQGDKAPARL